jgi:hypothetical protein
MVLLLPNLNKDDQILADVSSAYGNAMGPLFTNQPVNTSGIYFAIQEASFGFEGLGKDVPKAFIFTGIRLNTEQSPLWCPWAP